MSIVSSLLSKNTSKCDILFGSSFLKVNFNSDSFSKICLISVNCFSLSTMNFEPKINDTKFQSKINIFQLPQTQKKSFRLIENLIYV